MVDDKLKQDKIKMWTEKLVALEKEYQLVMQQRGEAAQMGDLSENSAYQMLTEQGEVLSARIGETKKIIKDLGGNPEANKTPEPVVS
jgi:transcription elongation GreA/GreB family factor